MNEREQERASTSERVWRFGRNINALGAAALAGVAIVIPGSNPILAGLAGLNVVQAGGFEWLRRRAQRRRGN